MFLEQSQKWKTTNAKIPSSKRVPRVPKRIPKNAPSFTLRCSQCSPQDVYTVKDAHLGTERTSVVGEGAFLSWGQGPLSRTGRAMP